MNNVEFTKLIASTLFGGVIYWLIEMREYLYVMLSSGRIPFDAFFIIYPVLLFAGSAGFFVCMPIYYFMRKYRLVRLESILVVSILVAIMFTNMVTGRWYDGVSVYLETGLVGCLSGLLFYFLIKTEM